LQDPARGWLGDWSPGIGDPTFVGWLTVVAYLVAAFLSFRVYRGLRAESSRARPPGLAPAAATLRPVLTALTAGPARIARMPLASRMLALWFGITAVLLFLGINKQLDLQTALTESARILAHAGGWYERRRKLQVVFIFGIVVAGAWLFRTVVLLARGNIDRLRSVLVGIVFLICFVAIRAASFHHIDEMLGSRLAGFKLNWIFELGGIAMVIHGATKALRAREEASETK
jgi:hypothetical protein